MKVSLSKTQIIQLSCAGVFLLAALAFDWVGISHLQDTCTLAGELADRKGKTEIAEVMAAPGGVGATQKEITQLEQLLITMSQKEESILSPWKQANQEAKGVGKDWAKDPNKWKDQLVKYNDEILKRSSKTERIKSVVLATNFYLGLEDFKQRSPREEQVPDLALQLSASKRLVDLLFQAKENALEGYPTPCTLLQIQGPASQREEGSPEVKGKERGGGNTSPKRDRYSLEFTCSPEVLFAFLNNLTTDSFFFVPVDMVLYNEKEAFPKRSELASQFTGSPAAGGVGTEMPRGEGRSVAPPLLKILAGDEMLRIKLQVDLIQFQGPEPSPISAKPKNS